MLLYNMTHPGISATASATLERQAVRAVVLDGKNVLLLYTRRYNDYSFPGGGLDAGESPEQGLIRELQEETGATGIRIERYLGYGDERRPAQKPGYDVLFMRSHFYRCHIDQTLGQAAPEDYELRNGMVPRWIDIDEAIAHNESVLRDKPGNMGMSIERETIMLHFVAIQLSGICATRDIAPTQS